jgi:hypothetical protein
MKITAAVPVVNSARNQLTIGGDPRPAVALARPSAVADAADPGAELGVSA